MFHKETGITDLTDAEEARLEGIFDAENPGDVLTDLISGRALVGWTTHGHTAIDVNVYAYGPGRALFVGNHDNTYIGDALAELMDFDLEALTEALRKQVREAAASDR